MRFGNRRTRLDSFEGRLLLVAEEEILEGCGLLVIELHQLLRELLGNQQRGLGTERLFVLSGFLGGFGRGRGLFPALEWGALREWILVVDACVEPDYQRFYFPLG